MIKKNKLKFLALLSSVCLWIYVMAVVNPESKMLFEGLPVNISNTLELAENNLILSSETKPTIDIMLEGRISDLRSLKKENIRASLEISNPSEGKNEGIISISVPNNINYKLKENNLVVRLEKNIYAKKDISIELPKNIDSSKYIISSNHNTVKVSGPRSAIKKIDKIVASIKEDSFSLNKNIGVQLKTLDSNGNEIENVALENSIVEVNVKEVKEKEVNVIPVFDKNNTEEITTNPIKITISGEASLINTINEVYTKPISLDSLKEIGSINADIDLIDGVSFVNKENSNNTPNQVTISLVSK